MSLDRSGFEYAKLLETQDQHLALWKSKIRLELCHPISEYVKSHNEEAKTPQDKHQVFRGQDIVEIIRTWPEPGNAGYPPRKKFGSDFI